MSKLHNILPTKDSFSISGAGKLTACRKMFENGWKR